MANHRTSKTKRHQREEEDESEDEEDERVLFFIPSAGINIEVLVFYLKQFLGVDSDAEPGCHPRNRDVDGYFIRSRLGLSTVMVADLKKIVRNGRKKRKVGPLVKVGTLGKATHNVLIMVGLVNYTDSETAASRIACGAGGQPIIPHKTQERTARRAASAQPSSVPARHANSRPPSGERHAHDRVPPDSIPKINPYLPSDIQQQSQVMNARQNMFHQSSSGDPGGGARPTLDYSINFNFAGYSQAPQFPPRNSILASRSENVLPSIEGRSDYHTPAPPYEENEESEEKAEGPSQPSTTGSHGFNLYPTAGSRHDRQTR